MTDSEPTRILKATAGTYKAPDPAIIKHERLTLAARAAILAGDVAAAIDILISRDRAGKMQARCEVAVLRRSLNVR